MVKYFGYVFFGFEVSDMQKKDSALGIVILTGSAVIWGVAFVFQVGSDLGSFWFNAIRFLISCICLVPFILFFDRKVLKDKVVFRKTLIWGGLTGIVLFIASTLQMYGILLSRNSGKAGFLTGLYMILVPIFCAIIFKEKITVLSIIAGTAGVAGLFLICLSNRTDFSFEWGDVLVFLSAIFFAIQIILIDRKAFNLPSFSFTFAQFAAVVILSVPAALIFERNIEISGQTLRDNLAPLLFCGIMSGSIAYTGQVMGQRLTSPDLASIIMCTESVWATLGGLIFLHENLGWMGYLGCALIFGGILISKIGHRFHKSNSSEPPKEAYHEQQTET